MRARACVSWIPAFFEMFAGRCILALILYATKLQPGAVDVAKLSQTADAESSLPGDGASFQPSNGWTSSHVPPVPIVVGSSYSPTHHADLFSSSINDGGLCSELGIVKTSGSLQLDPEGHDSQNHGLQIPDERLCEPLPTTIESLPTSPPEPKSPPSAKEAFVPGSFKDPSVVVVFDRIVGYVPNEGQLPNHHHRANYCSLVNNSRLSSILI